MRRRALGTLIVLLAAVLIGLLGLSGCGSSGSGGDAGGLPWVAESALPSQAQHELDLIDAGGPYRYPGKDGATFGNYEGLLPKESRGYYHEYTVDTPGSDDRGARRIITGSGGEFYYTQDHYKSFSRIRR